MRFEKFTNRLQQALSDAQSLAMGKDHTAIAGIHILSTLLEEPSNISLLQQAGEAFAQYIEYVLGETARQKNTIKDILNKVFIL